MSRSRAMTQLLLDNGADPTARAAAFPYTPLLYAVEEGNLDKMLVRVADSPTVPSSGLTELMLKPEDVCIRV